MILWFHHSCIVKTKGKTRKDEAKAAKQEYELIKDKYLDVKQSIDDAIESRFKLNS